MRILGALMPSNPNVVTALLDPKLIDNIFPIVLSSHSCRCLIVRELAVYIWLISITNYQIILYLPNKHILPHLMKHLLSILLLVDVVTWYILHILVHLHVISSFYLPNRYFKKCTKLLTSSTYRSISKYFSTSNITE